MRHRQTRLPPSCRAGAVQGSAPAEPAPGLGYQADFPAKAVAFDSATATHGEAGKRDKAPLGLNIETRTRFRNLDAGEQAQYGLAKLSAHLAFALTTESIEGTHSLSDRIHRGEPQEYEALAHGGNDRVMRVDGRGTASD